MGETVCATLRAQLSRLNLLDAASILNVCEQSLVGFSQTKSELDPGDVVDQKTISRLTESILLLGVQEFINDILPTSSNPKIHVLQRDEIVMQLRVNCQGCISSMVPQERHVMMEALSVQRRDTTDEAFVIIEQLCINGLDLLMCGLQSKGLLALMTNAFGVDATANDAIEQIIDIIFPPPPNWDNELPRLVPLPAKKDPALTKDKKKTKPSIPAVTPIIPFSVPAPVSTMKSEPGAVAAAASSSVVAGGGEDGEPSSKRVKEEAVKLTPEERSKLIKQSRHPLAKGISIDEIQNKYWTEELKQFCRENNMNPNMKKSKLNVAVFKFVNSGIIIPEARVKGRGGKGRPTPQKRPREDEEDDGGGEEDEAGGTQQDAQPTQDVGNPTQEEDAEMHGNNSNNVPQDQTQAPAGND